MWHPLQKVSGPQAPCGYDTELFGACAPEAEELRRLAFVLQPVTDKVDSHVYHLMYGIFLYPLRNVVPLKFFEIGLGCNMRYGAGASAKLWRHLLAEAEIWEADVDESCVQAHTKSLQKARIKALSGDQGKATDVQRWIRESGGQFHAIVDDGGHENSMILTSFALLWDELLPGGLYFLEDLHLGRSRYWDRMKQQMVVSDVVQAWLEELVVGFPSCDPAARQTPGSLTNFNLWKLPREVQWMFCQPEACVLRKAPPPAADAAAPHILPDLFVKLLQPARNASFSPRLLLYGLPCAGQSPALLRWAALLPSATVTLLNPEDGCPGAASSSPKPEVDAQHVRREGLLHWASNHSSTFDVVVDSSNCTDIQLLETHAVLWGALKSSGLYVWPDLHGRSPAAGNITVVAVLQAWADDLLVGRQKFSPKHRPVVPSAHNPWWPPANLLFLGCEDGACVLGRWAHRTHQRIHYLPRHWMVKHQKSIDLHFNPAARCL
eukprot:EG_transcript_8536